MEEEKEKKSLWQEVIGLGRVIQWIVCGGGIAVCLCGGCMGWLGEEKIVQIILALIAAAFGLERIQKGT